MTEGQFRAIAIAVIFRGRELLVFEANDSVKNEVFYRPLGGGIDFGETAAEAVRRELREEIGTELRDVRRLDVLENIFTLEGERWHEIVFVFEARLADEALYGRERWEGAGEVEPFPVGWLPLERVERGDAILYPDGLLRLLASAESRSAD